MAILVGIIGDSGSGKTSSLRNFNNDEVAVISVSGRRLPFRSDLKTLSTDNYSTLAQWLPQIKQPSIVIDDAGFLMSNNLYKTTTTGFQKFDEIGKNFTNLILYLNSFPDEKIIYLMGHITLRSDGKEHFKTVGKQVDDTFVLEGRFSVTLKAVVKEGSYYFQTHNNGMDTVKSPMGMFEEDLIDNDLKMVDDVIREYWNIPRPTPEE